MVYVPNSRSGSVTVIDPKTYRVLDTGGPSGKLNGWEVREGNNATKLAGLTRIRSWVKRSSSMSFGPGTPITLIPTEHCPRSSMSGGASGPGPENRTHAG